ncbi:MAG: acetamidase/formamidase family protein [Bacteroidetes bacterium]|nr:acetamidase/formamidase family protein [Bacteroidota bacterium]
MKKTIIILFGFSLILILGCKAKSPIAKSEIPKYFKIDHTLTADQTHNKFSSIIEPVLRVKSGAVIEVFTEEASDQELNINSTKEAIGTMNADLIHPITGPVYVEGAEPGDVITVNLLEIEIGDWGWLAIFPGFGILDQEFTEPYLRNFKLDDKNRTINFKDHINIQLKPFPGVMGVAPPTDEMLSTIPPRANGGNMDNPFLVEGTLVHFPVFVEGALFSIGDGHAAQGLGEVCGTAIEAPMRIVYRITLEKGGRSIPEPEYENNDYYAVSAYGTTLIEASQKATKYMVDYLEKEFYLSREEAYLLCSIAGDLHIAEVVDLPHYLVSMHISKKVLGL